LRYRPQRALTYACCVLVLLGSFHTRSTCEAAEGLLGRIRDSVRGVPSGDSPPPAPAPKPTARQIEDHRRRAASRYSSKYPDHGDDVCDLDLWAYLAFGGLAVASSPFWGPPAVLGDRLATRAYFPDFPYADVPGYLIASPHFLRFEKYGAGAGDQVYGVGEEDDPLVKYMEDPLAQYGGPDGPLSAGPRNWSGRIRFEYADELDDITRLGGSMLLSTTSRIGLDMEMHHFEETLIGTVRDELWLGDFNVVYRFAQSERAQFRAGLGMNWLDDAIDTDTGFNFTYGVDVFPEKPWILSATIDWGTLGSAELFRFRTSVGLIIDRVEVYSGYEYLDIDDCQINALMGGLRVWF